MCVGVQWLPRLPRLPQIKIVVGFGRDIAPAKMELGGSIMQGNWRKARIASLEKACRNLQDSNSKYAAVLIAGHEKHIRRLKAGVSE